MDILSVLSTDNVITIIIVLVGYLIAGITAFVTVNVKVAKNERDIESCRLELLTFKNDMKDTITEIKQDVRSNRDENKEDHEVLLDKITTLLKEDRKENKEASERTARALGNVAVNVGELRVQVENLTKMRNEK